MGNIDLLCSYVLTFSPLFAAIFIMLIPSFDVESKNTISRFFALINFFAFSKIFISSFLNKKINNIVFNINIDDITIKFIANLEEKNLMLMGFMSLIVLIFVYLFVDKEQRNNLHEAIPFLLAFIANILFGQDELALALPVLSISSFIIYFLLGFSKKPKKGSAIFHMGVFLFIFDTLALAAIQYKNLYAYDSKYKIWFQLFVLIPGLSRMGIALFAPYMRRFFGDMSEKDGTFLACYLQILGYFLLGLAKDVLHQDIKYPFVFMGIIATISSFLIAVTALSSYKSGRLPYYFLSFYSSIVAATLFFSADKTYWYLSSSLFLCNIILFIHSEKLCQIIHEKKYHNIYRTKLKATWFLSLSLLLSIPGIGIGTTIWPIIYTIARDSLYSKGSIFTFTWQVVFFFYGISLILLSLAVILNLRDELVIKNMPSEIIISTRGYIKKLVFVSLSSTLGS